MANLKVLALCGSLRTNSFNKKLMLETCEELKTQSFESTVLDLRSLSLPLYDGDLEEAEGMPIGAKKLVDALVDADALLIASPEYNGSITGVLKNAIDWASRAQKNPFVNKVILLVGTSTGWWGASKANIHTRQIFNHLRAVVVPIQIAIPNAEEAFDENGRLKSEFNKNMIKGGVADLVRMTKALAGS